MHSRGGLPMLRRQACWFGLLVLALLGGLALAIALGVEPPELRRRLLMLVCVFAVAGVGGVFVLSYVLARQFRRPLRELVAAISRFGEEGVGPRFVGDDPELAVLADSFNAASE